MKFDELADQIRNGHEPDLEVHGLTPSVYAAFVVDGDARSPLLDGSETRIFTSRFAALRALQKAGATRATFVHRSAYDEMVNAPGGGEGNEFREPVDLSRL